MGEASEIATNDQGKRVVCFDNSENCGEGKKIFRPKDRIEARRLEQDVAGIDGLLKNRDESANNTQPLSDDKEGKGAVPFDPKHLLQAMSLYSSAWENSFPGISILRRHGGSVANGDVDGVKGTDPVLVKSDKSVESATESEETSGEDQEEDSAGSEGYGIATDNEQDVSADRCCLESDINAAKKNIEMFSEDASFDDPFDHLLLGTKASRVVKLETTDNSGLTVGLNSGETGNCFEEPCSCSFCLKAGYMLVDLHYQDARGRFSALKRSSRLARSFGSRIGGNYPTAKTSLGKSKIDLESELSDSWRSLFNYTENILSHEASQLHSTLLSLKELRANCKNDLKMISMDPSKK